MKVTEVVIGLIVGAYSLWFIPALLMGWISEDSVLMLTGIWAGLVGIMLWFVILVGLAMLVLYSSLYFLGCVLTWLLNHQKKQQAPQFKPKTFGEHHE